jgi:parallel beta-helix repeat protein
MAVHLIGATERSYLTDNVVKDTRFYIDPRQMDYPPNDGHTLDWTLITSADNQCGTHNLTSGYADYEISLDGVTEMTIIVRAYPQFDYDTASTQYLWSWYIDASHEFQMYYIPTSDKMQVRWLDGGTARYCRKTDSYANNAALQKWQDFAFTVDFTNKDAAFYIDRVAQDTSWSNTADAKTSTFPIFSLRHHDGTAGNFDINYVRIFLNKEATSTEIGNDMQFVQDEEIYFPLNGCGLARTRCNVTDYVKSYWIGRERENDNAQQTANRFSMDLYNENGEFDSAQYNAFDPANGNYNGTTSDKYLQKRCRVMMDYWYDHVPQLAFVGRLTPMLFQRQSSVDNVATIHFECEDQVEEMGRGERYYAKRYDGADFCDPAAESDSLIHLITRLASDRTVTNYLANSSFENATISDSWSVSGAGATFTKQGGGLYGSNQGDLVYGAATCYASQCVMFDEDKKLNVEEKYTFSVYLKSASACGHNIRISEQDSGGENDYTDAAWSLSGGEGWTKFSVTHEITDGDSDRLYAMVLLDDNVTLSIDAAQLTMSSREYNWFVLNDNDGSSGVEDADDADTASYHTHGFDADTVAQTMSYCLITDDDPIWEYLKELAVASITEYIGMDASGTFKYRSYMKTGYADPTPLFTVDSPRELITTIERNTANKIIVHGAIYKLDAHERCLWDAYASGMFSDYNYDFPGSIQMSVANNGYWPPAAFRPLWAEYTHLKRKIYEHTFHRPWPLNDTIIIDVPYYTKEGADSEIIGATNLFMVERTEGSWTETTFDTTTRDDAARILLKNETGAAAELYNVRIWGKPIMRTPHDKGYIHDDLEDMESIEREGLKKIEIGNDFIFDTTQMEEIADYWWKLKRTTKHRYLLTIPGTALYYEPGEWYTLTIGASGEPDYISSTVRCHAVQIEGMAGDLGMTNLTLEEVEENWAKTINAVTKIRTPGNPLSFVWTNRIKVGPADAFGIPDIQCDGTSDETEINSAITAMNNLGGGLVELMEGHFYIDNSIDMLSNVSLVGRGWGTVIEKNCNDYGIHFNGTSGTHVENCFVGHFKITRDSSDTNSKALIYATYTDNTFLEKIYVYDSYDIGIQGGYCDNFKIRECKIEECANDYAVLINNVTLASYNTPINENVITNCLGGIKLQYARDTTISGNRISDIDRYAIYVTSCERINIENNICSDGLAANTTYSSSIGIYLFLSDYCKVTNNVVYNFRGFGVGLIGGPTARSSPCGILLKDADYTTRDGNYCYGNGNIVEGGQCDYPTEPEIEGTTGVTKTNISTSQVSTQYYFYNDSWEISLTAGGSVGELVLTDNQNTNDMHGFIAGEAYEFETYLKILSATGPDAAEVSVVFRQYHSAAWHETEVAATTQDAWEHVVTGEVAIDASATGCHPLVRIASTASAGEKIYLGMAVVRPATENNYDEGNFHLQYSGVATGW